MNLPASSAKRVIFAGANVASIVVFGIGVGFRSIFFALMAAICILGVLALIRPWLGLRVPGRWRRVRPWEPRLYRSLGVRAFGKWLRNSSARNLNREVYFAPDRELPVVRANLEYAEAVHFWDVVVTLPYFPVAAADHSWTGFAVLSDFNIFGNIYPILHLRLARGRLQRILPYEPPRSAA